MRSSFVRLATVCLWGLSFALGCTSSGSVAPAVDRISERVPAHGAIRGGQLRSPESSGIDRGLSRSGSTALEARVVQAAESRLGASYRYGGSGPETFDCSGLVVYSYARAGLPGLPHSSRALYRSTQRISLSELRPGDLLFFDFDSERISHVGIYVGEREFIHAPKSGRGVERVRFDHPYWSRHLGTAGRVVRPQRLDRSLPAAPSRGAE